MSESRFAQIFLDPDATLEIAKKKLKKSDIFIQNSCSKTFLKEACMNNKL
jgi:hypothetical protein